MARGSLLVKGSYKKTTPSPPFSTLLYQAYDVVTPLSSDWRGRVSFFFPVWWPLFLPLPPSSLPVQDPARSVERRPSLSIRPLRLDLSYFLRGTTLFSLFFRCSSRPMECRQIPPKAGKCVLLLLSPPPGILPPQCARETDSFSSLPIAAKTKPAWLSLRRARLSYLGRRLLGAFSLFFLPCSGLSRLALPFFPYIPGSGDTS